MSERRSSADLGASAEAVLSAFPFAEREWESDARAVEARLAESVRGTTDDLLLSAPLPSEPGEGSSPSATTTPLAHSGVRTQSLADLARRSVEKKQAGEREMARASLAIAAQQRPTGGEARAMREAVDTAAATASPPPSVVSAIVASAPTAQATTHANTRAAATTSAWPKLALAIVPVLALAAATLFWLKRPEPTPLVGNAIPVAPNLARPMAATTAKVTETPAGSPIANGPNGVDPSTLPDESPTRAAQLAHAKAAPAEPAAPGANLAAAAAKTEKIVLEDEQPAAAPVAAAAVEKPSEKTLPPDPALRPADSSGGELPVKPSTGAVQAALGSVMSGARHCVAGDDAPSSAVVVFGSDGRVQHVAVTGPAAGKSSGACIEAQLGRARVQPFASANFSVSATVRPD